MKDSAKLSIEKMPFYKSMMEVQTASGIEPGSLILWQLGFKAVPDACMCGKHEWSAFDLMIESVSVGQHTWEFYRGYTPSAGFVPQTFRNAVLTTGLKCPSCGQRSAEINVLYNYAQQCCPGT